MGPDRVERNPVGAARAGGRSWRAYTVRAVPSWRLSPEPVNEPESEPGYFGRGRVYGISPTEQRNQTPSGRSPWRAVTTVWIPPRTAKSPVTSIQRGASARARSSQIRFVTASWNVPSSRKLQR